MRFSLMDISSFIENNNLWGLIIGLCTFVIIGIFHPLVIKGYYYLGVRSKWLFGIAGLAFAIAAVLIENLIADILLGVTAFSCFWSIHEVTQQVERVRKGWFPEGPAQKRQDSRVTLKK